MKKIIALILTLISTQVLANDGSLYLRNINGLWALTKPNGVSISINQSTYGFPEATTEALNTGNPLLIRCLGPQQPLNFTNFTWVIPAQINGNIKLEGCTLNINNTETINPAIKIDTYSYGKIDFSGSKILYTGNGSAVLIRPENSVQSAGQVNPITTWLRHTSMNFGTIISIGGNPTALLELDPTGVNTNDPYLSSGIVSNSSEGIKFVGECYGNAKHALLLNSPLNGRQLVSQNYIQFYVESCKEEEIKIGSNSQYDVGLSTNIIVGNPTHTRPDPGFALQSMVYSNASYSQFYLNSLNNERGSNLPSLFKFGPNANGNVVCTRQAFGGNSIAIDQTGTNSFTCGSPVQSQPQNIIGTTGEPFTVNLFAGTWTMLDMSWKVPNGATVTKLGLYATSPMTVPLILARRDSAGTWTEIVTQSITHAGGGWQDVSISPLAIPATGDYYVGIYTTGLNQTFIDYKPRALIQNVQLVGTMSGITEESPHAQWYVIPVRITYQ